MVVLTLGNRSQLTYEPIVKKWKRRYEDDFIDAVYDMNIFNECYACQEGKDEDYHPCCDPNFVYIEKRYTLKRLFANEIISADTCGNTFRCYYVYFILYALVYFLLHFRTRV